MAKFIVNAVIHTHRPQTRVASSLYLQMPWHLAVLPCWVISHHSDEGRVGVSPANFRLSMISNNHSSPDDVIQNNRWYLAKYRGTSRLESLRPTDVCACQQTIESLVKIMACCLFGAKPLPKPILTYCQLDPNEIYLKFKSFHSRKCIPKCRLQNG